MVLKDLLSLSACCNLLILKGCLLKFSLLFILLSCITPDCSFPSFSPQTLPFLFPFGLDILPLTSFIREALPETTSKYDTNSCTTTRHTLSHQDWMRQPNRKKRLSTTGDGQREFWRLTLESHKNSKPYTSHKCRGPTLDP